jgi:TRAP-type uncharacterized transport system substrate-binding protein
VIVGAAVCLFAALPLLRLLPLRTHRIQMATDVVPLRLHLAELIREEGSRHHVELVLSSKHYGSLEALAELESPSEIKLALVPGGIKVRDYPTVRQVAILAVEPLHVFIRPELAAKGLSGLRGKRIACGPTTTASNHIAREVLAFVGLRPGANPGAGGYTLDPVSPDDLQRELERIDALKGPERDSAVQALPDAVLFLAPTPSLLGKQLAHTAGYHLLPVPFAEAFCRERLSPPTSDGVRVDRSVLNPVSIPPFTYGHDPVTPSEPCLTVGAPLLLVAQDDADPEAVARVLEAIYDSPLTNAIRPPPLREQVAAFPLHRGTERYLHRNDPLLRSEDVVKLGPLLGGIGAMISGLFAFYSFMRLRKLRRFEAYYKEIEHIDMLARGVEVDPDAPSDPDSLRAHLETRLTTIKHDAVKDFAEGGLHGEGLIAGIIALINDTRGSLARMTVTESTPPTQS